MIETFTDTLNCKDKKKLGSELGLKKKKVLTLKSSFDETYTKRAPTDYLRNMALLDYRIPDQTKILYLLVLEELGIQNKVPNILDLGSSYGVNTLLLKYDLCLDDLYEIYNENGKNRGNLKEYLESKEFHPFEFTLLDISEPALKFAKTVGLADHVICHDLEKAKLELEDVSLLKSLDLVISTGCMGYVTERGLHNLLSSLKESDSQPFFAFSLLRLFPSLPFEAVFAENDYCCLKIPNLFLKQRKFKDADERKYVLRELKIRAIDTHELEKTNYHIAEFFIAGPKDRLKKLNKIHRLLRKMAPLFSFRVQR